PTTRPQCLASTDDTPTRSRTERKSQPAREVATSTTVPTGAAPARSTWKASVDLTSSANRSRLPTGRPLKHAYWRPRVVDRGKLLRSTALLLARLPVLNP